LRETWLLTVVVRLQETLKEEFREWSCENWTWYRLVPNWGKNFQHWITLHVFLWSDLSCSEFCCLHYHSLYICSRLCCSLVNIPTAASTLQYMQRISLVVVQHRYF